MCVKCVCGWNIMSTSPCWLFAVCISPAVMTLTAKRCLSADYVCLLYAVRVILWHRQHPLPSHALLHLLERRNVHTFACKSGIKHLSAITAAAPLERDVNVSRGGWRTRGVGGGGVAGTEPNRKRQEKRWPDKPYGSLLLCPKGSHLSSHSWPTWPGGKFQCCKKKLCEMKPDGS